MGVYGKVINTEGRELRVSKPCFGFLHYITSWRHGSGLFPPLGYEGDSRQYIENFACSALLSRFEWEYRKGNDLNPDTRELFDNQFGGFDNYVRDIIGAARQLNQYYENFNFDHAFDEEFPYICVPLTTDDNMQHSIIGGMMLRNLLHYNYCIKAYAMFKDAGLSSLRAFVYAQVYYAGQNFNGEIRFSTQFGGDNQIFPRAAGICDLAAMLKKKSFPWQGNWGDTDHGYGRDGWYGSNNDFDGDDPESDDEPLNRAPELERTQYYSQLSDVTLTTDANWYNLENFGNSTLPRQVENVRGILDMDLLVSQVMEGME